MYPPINVEITIITAGNQFSEEQWKNAYEAAASVERGAKPKYADEVTTRVKQLALDALPTVSDGVTGEYTLRQLEDRAWNLAASVKKPVLLYETKDYKSAIDFLEVFVLYSLQFKQAITSHDRHTHTGIVAGGGARYDKAAFKAIKELEELNISMGNEKIDKRTVAARVERLIKQIDKVLLNNLGKTEQRAFSETVNTAKQILSNLI